MQVMWFADVYGRGAYGSDEYSCATTTNCAADATAGGGLSNTGIAVIGFATIACVIIVIAIIVKAWRRKPAVAYAPTDQGQEQPVQSEKPDTSIPE